MLSGPLCEHALLKRALKEYHKAPPEILEAKWASLRLLVRYGWRDVFKENLSPDGRRFRSEEDAVRFACRPE